MEVKSKKNVIAKLITARGAIQDALQLGSPVARFDPVLMPNSARNGLSLVENHLDRIIQELQGEQ